MFLAGQQAIGSTSAIADKHRISRSLRDLEFFGRSSDAVADPNEPVPVAAPVSPMPEIEPLPDVMTVAALPSPAIKERKPAIDSGQLAYLQDVELPVSRPVVELLLEPRPVQGTADTRPDAAHEPQQVALLGDADAMIAETPMERPQSDNLVDAIGLLEDLDDIAAIDASRASREEPDELDQFVMLSGAPLPTSKPLVDLLTEPSPAVEKAVRELPQLPEIVGDIAAESAQLAVLGDIDKTIDYDPSELFGEIQVAAPAMPESAAPAMPEALIPMQPETPFAEVLDKPYEVPQGEPSSPEPAEEPAMVVAGADIPDDEPIPLIPDRVSTEPTESAPAASMVAEPAPMQPRPMVRVTAPPRPQPRPERRPELVLAAAHGDIALGPGDTTTSSTDTIRLESGKGRMIRLPQAVDAVFVAEPEIADVQLKSPRMMFVFGRATGDTTIYAVSSDETIVLSRRVQVAHNLTRLDEMIELVHPGSLVETNSLNNSVVLKGLVPDVETAEDIVQLAARVVGENGSVVNRLRVAGVNQVNLRVRIAEVSREVSKQLGINWDVLFDTGSTAIGFATLGVGEISALSSNIALGSLQRGNWDINAIIDALDDQNLITVLAEPNLTALSGESAQFLAGGEFPIPIAQGDDTISITFKQFGVSLAFSPQVLSSGRINMKVLSEVSQLSETGAIEVNGFRVPGLNTRRTNTTIEMRSGQSFAIAGLLQTVTNQTVDKYPGLADLPILGPLFKSERFRRDETELLVIVTPYLVRPASTQLATPVDGFVPPTDQDRFLSRLHRSRVPDSYRPPRDGSGRPGGVGDAGFIVR